MAITTSQIFQLGSIAIAWAAAVGTMIDPAQASTLIAPLAAATLTAWNGVAAILTGQNAQTAQTARAMSTDQQVRDTMVAAVAQRINDPNVKGPMVTAVSNLPGVTNVGVDRKLADNELRAVAANPEVPKVNIAK